MALITDRMFLLYEFYVVWNMFIGYSHVLLVFLLHDSIHEMICQRIVFTSWVRWSDAILMIMSAKLNDWILFVFGACRIFLNLSK